MLLQPIQVSKQHKRGLFNFVGELGSTLFGTAKAKQVQACKRQIEEARKLQQTIVYSYNEMTTVINQTRADVSLNRAHLQKVETVVNNVFQQMILTELSLTKTVTKVSTLEEEVIIDRLLTALESVHNLWLRHADRYRWQRASLELGQLTEEILSPHDLRSILDVSYERGLFSPGLAWYYHHVTLQPVWEEYDRLVFSAQLPLMDKTRYARYTIRAWPVPDNGTDQATQVLIPSDVAVDTVNGGIVEPHQCLGTEPAICRAGPVYTKGRLLCARGVLSGHWTRTMLKKLLRLCSW